MRRHLAGRPTRLILILLAMLLGGFVFAIFSTPLGNSLPAVKDSLNTLGRWIATHRRIVALWTLGLFAACCLVWLIVNLSLIERIHGMFDRHFERLRRFYGGLLDWSLDHPGTLVTAFLGVVVLSCGLYLLIGNDFFPSVDAGLIRLHVRCPPGTRIEQTQQRFAEVESAIRQLIPGDQIVAVLDDMGIPNSGINLSLSDGSLISPADGEILLSLTPQHNPTAQYLRQLRHELPRRFPDLAFFFLPSDIVTQVLNFGLAAPVDVQVAGPAKNADKDLALARQMMGELAALPGIVDVHLQQVPETPDLRINVDRTLASQVDVTQKDVASDLLISLSSSNQTAPNFWLNPQNGVNYSIYVQTPQYRLDTLNALENTPVVPAGIVPGPGSTQLLANLAGTAHGSTPTNATHYNISPTYDVLLGVQGTDLGSAATDVNRIVANYQKQLPRGSTIALRGQMESMHASFTGLAYGLIFAVVLVYLLMVVNFQSWLDPLIILMALPGAIAGMLWMLWATQTTISVPALMGAIMSIGVALATVKQAEATIGVAQADVQRLTVLQGFEKVVAPFSGIITARNYDVGALVTPGTTSTVKEIFRLVQSTTLRAFIYVPQVYALEIRPGQEATLSVRNYPDRQFPGTVARMAGELAASSRTMLFEVHFDNPKGELYAGMYGQVRLTLSSEKPALVIPTAALIFDAAGTQVATVHDSHVHLRNVTVGRDLGTELEVLSGLNSTDDVISNPAGQLSEGALVQVMPAQKAVAQAQ